MNNSHKLGTQATTVMAGFIALMVLPVQIASALILSLYNGTSQADYVDTQLTSWKADGVNQLTQASTYVKVEGLENCATDSDGYFLLEESGCFQKGLSQLLDTNGDGKNDFATFYYNSQDFAITINYKLQGPVTGAFPTSINKTVTINNQGSKRNFDIVNYYNLTLNNDFGDSAYILPETKVGYQVDVPNTLLATISPSESSADAYEVGEAKSFKIAALNNVTGPSSGNPAIAYRFSEALETGSVSLSQDVTIKNTNVFDAPRILLQAAMYNPNMVKAAGDDDLGIQETPELGSNWLSLSAIAALMMGSKLTRRIKRG